MPKAQNIPKIILGLLVLLLSLLFFELVKSPTTNDISINFLNVGQGDAALIQRGKYQILIDGGPDDSVLAELGKVMPLSDREIELIILTHPHADHLTGLNQVFDRYQVDKIVSTAVLDTTSQYLKFLNTVKDKNISFVVPKIGEQISTFDNANLLFLWPGDRMYQKPLANINNSSEVVKFCYSSSCALFTGDIEIDEQNTMLDYYSSSLSVFDSQIVKIPHHGSSNANNERLLRAISPEFAVISVGRDNMYGHPHQATLDLLNKINIKTFRTDQDGTVQFKLDGKNVSPI